MLLASRAEDKQNYFPPIAMFRQPTHNPAILASGAQKQVTWVA